MNFVKRYFFIFLFASVVLGISSAWIVEHKATVREHYVLEKDEEHKAI